MNNTNNRILLLIIAVAVVVGGFLIFNKSNTQMTGQQSQSQPTGQPGTQPQAQEPVVQRSEVAVTASGFNPQVLTIKAGESVIWTNTSGSAVTVNSDVHPTHLLYPFLNLGEFNDGSSVSVVVEKPGTYTYHNHLNPSQTGKIIAE
jgi:plastocyanin